jgi:hypothetical protein
MSALHESRLRWSIESSSLFYPAGTLRSRHGILVSEGGVLEVFRDVIYAQIASVAETNQRDLSVLPSAERRS